MEPSVKQCITGIALAFLMISLSFMVIAIALPKWTEIDGGSEADIGLFKVCLPGNDECISHSEYGLDSSVWKAILAVCIVSVVFVCAGLVCGFIVLWRENRVAAFVGSALAMVGSAAALTAIIIFLIDSRNNETTYTTHYGSCFYLAIASQIASLIGGVLLAVGKPSKKQIRDI